MVSPPQIGTVDDLQSSFFFDYYANQLEFLGPKANAPVSGAVQKPSSITKQRHTSLSLLDIH